MLDDLMAIFEQRCAVVSRRGTGAAQFLYLTSGERAVEVSEDGDLLWLEFWESADEQADDPPVKELSCASIETAVIEIDAWLEGSR